MNKITGLLPSQSKKGYTDIYVDGEFLMTVNDDAVIEASLKTGKEIDGDAISEIDHAITLTRAKTKSYTYLQYGDMSAKKLYDKLIHAGFEDGMALECVEQMKDAGYINDTRYAASVANNLANVKLYGPRRIREELYKRGITGDDADIAIDGLETDFDQNIKSLITGKFRSKTDRHKLIAALIRYGYDYDMIGYTDYE